MNKLGPSLNAKKGVILFMISINKNMLRARGTYYSKYSISSNLKNINIFQLQNLKLKIYG